MQPMKRGRTIVEKMSNNLPLTEEEQDYPLALVPARQVARQARRDQARQHKKARRDFARRQRKARLAAHNAEVAEALARQKE